MSSAIKVMATDLHLTSKHVDRLLNILADVAANWILFMGQLGLSNSKIKMIERDVATGNKRSIECLRAALFEWMSCSGCDNPTYSAIAVALRSKVLQYETLAREVEDFAQRIKGRCGILCSD